ncbi:DUF2254 domain-containing protein [Arthrobacter tumbae]|uniref:DUF2254 domain-containing protein n=1 Tax=Arthrobacter tumbae TaxID=163874 RepID=UPI0019587B09|nr:DUF2254 domain-containing protein [Arthrobacter tumbae]MBM7779913.1 putative membrane protein [Arthrobacter tumbae]
MQRFELKHWLKTRMWVIPVLFVLGGVALSWLFVAIDPEGTLVPQSISGDPTAAMQILYLISFAMLTLTGLVLSLLVLVVQLAMGSFSPRIVRQILQDRPSQCAIGLFAGTFTFSLLTMRTIVTSPEGGTVPGLAVVVSILLVLSCIVTLVWYLNHIGQSLRVAALVDWVAADTISTLDRVFPDAGPKMDIDHRFIRTPRSGVLFEVDHDCMIDLARTADCSFEVLWSIGDFVPTNAPVIRIHGQPAEVETDAVVGCIAIGPERTLNQDVAYGIRMLVDIAIGAVSSGPFDDPTTTVQAIDRLHDVLRQIVRRPLHSGEYRDDDGVLRLSVPALSWDGFVELAFDEIRRSGAASPQITRRLMSALNDLLKLAPEDRRPALERQRKLLQESMTAAVEHPDDRLRALIQDPSGIGSAGGLSRSPRHPEP